VSPKAVLVIEALEETSGGWDQVTTRLEVGEFIEISAPDRDGNTRAIARVWLDGVRLL
jgi:hypothetical protein